MKNYVPKLKILKVNDQKIQIAFLLKNLFYIFPSLTKTFDITLSLNIRTKRETKKGEHLFLLQDSYGNN